MSKRNKWIFITVCTLAHLAVSVIAAFRAMSYTMIRFETGDTLASEAPLHAKITEHVADVFLFPAQPLIEWFHAPDFGLFGYLFWAANSALWASCLYGSLVLIQRRRVAARAA